MRDKRDGHAFGAKAQRDSCIWGNETHLANASAPSILHTPCRQANIAQIRGKCLGTRLLELVANARANGIRFNWVGCDGLYGSSPWFLRELDRGGELFVADVHSDQVIYLEDPDLFVPDRKSKRGRKSGKRQARTKGIRVDKWVKQQPPVAGRRITVRDSTKGVLQVDVFGQNVWLWNQEEAVAQHWQLIVRREVNAPGKIKYSLSNARQDMPLERLAYMQAQRYWVERSFQDGKSQCGMGEYQARGWYAWHHNMSLVMMGQLFMLEERLLHQETEKLLSTSDITTLLNYYLPRRDITEEEVLRQLKKGIESDRPPLMRPAGSR